MSLFRVHLTAGLFLVLSIGYTSSVVYKKMNLTTFEHDNSVVLHDREGSTEYYKFHHLDGNLDGVITKLEIENVEKFSATLDAYDFAESLNTLDKRLVYGLSFTIAKQAVEQLNETEKLALLQINLPERVNLINSRFA